MTSPLPGHDDDLRRLLTETAESVEPSDRLTRIRAATRPRRPRAWVVPLAAAATVATVAGAAALGYSRPWQDSPALPPGSSTSSPTGTVSDDPTDDPTGSPTDEPSSPGQSEEPSFVAVPVYYLGDTSRGLRLFREWQQAPTSSDVVTEAVQRAVATTPADPDYRTAWPAGTQAYAEPWAGDVLTVVVESADGGGALRERPSDMTVDEARLAIEQLIWSAQGALGEGRVPVQLLLDGGRTDQLLGVPVSEPLANGPFFETLSMVNITTPTEGETVAGERLTVTGVGNGFEGTVVVEILDGEEVLAQEPTIAGTYEEKLFPFEATLPLRDIPPGTYTVRAWTENAEAGGPDHLDTKTIVIP